MTHDRSLWVLLPGVALREVGSAGLLPVFFLVGPCPAVPAWLDAAAAVASVRAVHAGCDHGSKALRSEMLLAVRAHDDAWGWRGPSGRAAPWAGSHSRGRGRTPRRSSRPRH